MAIELKIRFDGSTPGLSEHRLSLSEFHDALGNLLSAVRRTATSIETTATDPEAGAAGGRYSKTAGNLDVQLSGLEDGCVQMSCIIAHEPPAGQNQKMFPELERRTLRRFVEDIDEESKGTPSNAAARRFLRSLPTGVNSQRYAIIENGQETFVAEFGVFEDIAEERIEQGPELVRLIGFIQRVTFDEEGEGVGVDIRGDDETLRSIDASPANVEKALSLRGSKIIAQVVVTKDSKRLVTLWAENNPPSKATREERTSRILDDWSDTLSELAK